jgi:hypothetical protein
MKEEIRRRKGGIADQPVIVHLARGGIATGGETAGPLVSITAGGGSALAWARHPTLREGARIWDESAHAEQMTNEAA